MPGELLSCACERTMIGNFIVNFKGEKGLSHKSRVVGGVVCKFLNKE